MIWFTSDTHFNHKNIILYCDRPFLCLDGQPDVPGMNAGLIERWNECVDKDDLVCHLGDFAFGGAERTATIRRYLNGRILLVRGNHDSKPDRWLRPGDRWVFSLQAGEVFLGHVPPGPNDYRDLPCQPIPEGTKVMLCGHVHDKWKERDYNGIRVINVGVDINFLKPIPVEELNLTSEQEATLCAKLIQEAYHGTDKQGN